MTGIGLSKKIVVFGGTGFLGKRICENAISRGYDVVSITGTGKKPNPYEGEESSWINKVNWKRGNIFYPETYTNELKNAKAVVHSIGILLENDSYKKIVGSNDGIINTVSDLFKTSNPMAKTPDITGNNVIIDKTYERFNTQSALVSAEALIQANHEKPAFVYISADRGFPGIPSGYIESKRRTEYELYQMQPEIRPVFLRPGFMYDPSEENHNSIRKHIKNSMDILEGFNKKLLFNSLDGIIRPTISTKLVAKWCIDKIEDDEFRGPLMLDAMINLKNC
ncbi:hypothetical protein C6P40_000295 [Pichia californica]|uniref:NAD-dependent epimerase/dehydratase domain-containing protein n=1 Tax=Pichia californica TaxID=460514 RepID=A0A9P6WQ47_9ASCO|nr:hypothetical protein C6P42_002703 [[Candida] californica]KAG0691016.1 hypothetical protein C6P40_000295 [[Candida] californica]